MEFLKQNLFLVIVVAVVVALGGAVLALNFSVSSANDEQAAAREKLSSQLQQLSQGEKVNGPKLEAKKAQVNQTRDAYEELSRLERDWNRRTYPILELTYLDGGQGRTVPAFPLDREKYRQFRLHFPFVLQYRKELEEMLAKLQPTTIPSTPEIEEAQTAWQRRLEMQQETERLQEVGRDILGGAALPSPGAPYPMPGASPSGARGAGGIADEARQKGLAAAKVAKARQGLVYADLDSLNAVFKGDEVSASDSQLWQAQLNLWVTNDIVEAIRQTNQAIVERLPQDQRNVLATPIKRLVMVDVSEDYYVSGKALSGMPGVYTGAPGGLRPGGMPPLGYEPAPGDFQHPSPYGQPTGRGAVYPSYTSPPAPSAGAPSGRLTESEGSLTNRATNQDFEVLHYKFTVIAPTRYLPLLEEKLTQRNKHTVLNLAVEPVAATSSSGGRASSAEDLFYYGPDPVAKVTLTCELLLWTSWERGTWDDHAKEWSPQLPPLVPAEVLEKLAATRSDLLRSEDLRRVQASSLGPGR